MNVDNQNKELLEVKLHLKKWELKFVKENGCKPTKRDIADNKEIENIYAKYFRLKRDSSTSFKLENNKAENNTKVWGKNLLKANQRNNHADEAFENVNTNPAEKVSTPTYSQKLKQNIGRTYLKSLPTKLQLVRNMNHSKINEQITQVENAREANNMIIESVLNSSVEDSAASKNLQHQITKTTRCRVFSRNIQKTPYGSISKARSFLDKPINPALLEDPDSYSTVSMLNLKSEDIQVLVEHQNTNVIQATQAHEKTDTKKQNVHEEIENVNCEKPEVNYCEGKMFQTKNIDKISDEISTKICESSKCSSKSTKENQSILACHFNELSDIATSKIHRKKANLEQSDILKLAESNSSFLTQNLSPTKSPSCEEASLPQSESDGPSVEKNLETSFQSTSKKTSTGFRTRSVVSTNYVRVNIQKKVFLRKAGRGKFLRRKVFREKMAKKGFLPRNKWRGSGGIKKIKEKGDNSCFKCGQLGHWANQCTGTQSSRHFAAKQTLGNFVSTEENLKNTESLEDILSQHQLNSNDSSVEPVEIGCHTVHNCEPLYDDSNYNEEEVLSVLKQFGYTKFRPGQKEAIQRIMCGKPTLIVLSTGMGKSLCYQLPAYMYSRKRSSITLVVSPLVSLMDDQITGLPKFLKAVCLHSGMSKEQREKIMLEIEEKKVDILLVSPEAITSWAGMSSYTSPFSKLPPVSFACIDECHCLSEWSHNFRPSYLRVCQVLRDNLGVKCLVGLTATSTLTTCNSIARQLGISDCVNGIIKETSLPDNLRLSVSRDQYRDEALQELLLNEPFRSLQSIIVYCTRRDEAARLASFLRTTLQYQEDDNETERPMETALEECSSTSNQRKRKRTNQTKNRKRNSPSWDVDCYHAGMSPAERRRVQKRFMTGQLRVVVATVAFGMGIDKQDVRAVVHYNMPRSFERYVQEIGRAGRDGQPAFCHTFLNCEGEDLSELSRHIYAKTMDRYVVKQLVKKVFKACKCSEHEISCTGHLTSISIDPTIEELDLTREAIETLLCFLELDGLIKVYLPTHATCSLRCYDGPQQMALVAKKCPAVALGLVNEGTSTTLKNELEFSIVKVADRLGMNISNLKRSLRSLMWDTTLSSNPISGRSGVTVEFEGVSFLLKTLRKSDDDFFDNVTDSLHQRVLRQERKELAQLKTCFNTLQKFSVRNVALMQGGILDSKSRNLKAIIDEYFTKSENDLPNHNQICQIESTVETELRSSIRQFLCVHSADLGHRLTGRAIARIFHGIESPRYPATSWGRARRFWRSHLSINFNAIVKTATEELLKFR